MRTKPCSPFDLYSQPSWLAKVIANVNLILGQRTPRERVVEVNAAVLGHPPDVARAVFERAGWVIRERVDPKLGRVFIFSHPDQREVQL